MKLKTLHISAELWKEETTKFYWRDFEKSRTAFISEAFILLGVSIYLLSYRPSAEHHGRHVYSLMVESK
jgi:hypothetical protein